MTAISRAQRLALPLALVASVLVILVPLPPLVMDLLLAANIAMAVLILLTTVAVETPLEFSVFPTVLLSATLSRLVLNVATTRLILTGAGSSGAAAAGEIIDGFGSFVAGDQVLVGLIIFVIIVLIQFLVVTKGATRISEVAARFALDGMPGRQMAIDADAAAGLIDRQEARRRREELTRHADFYGAMDGASKFVRGDAIAGIVITFVNIAGGLFLGVTQYGMSVPEAAGIFTRLTIGDGLVSQLPAFLIALAAGLLVTRTAQKTNLPVEFLRQLIMRPEPLVVAATFLGVLVFTRLPAIPLLMVGGSFAGLAIALTRNPTLLDDEPPPESPATPQAENERKIEDLLAVDPIELELGVGLLRLADPQRGGNLLDLVSKLRQRVAGKQGTVLPKVRIRDNLGLNEYEYRFKIYGDLVAAGRAYPLRVLATPTSEASAELEGIACEDPIRGRDAWWIDPTLEDQVRRQGYLVTHPVDVIVGHLQRIAICHASELLTRDATKRLIDQARHSAPAIVDELVPEILSIGKVQQVLQGLLAEHVSIRNLPAILEAISDAAPAAEDAVALIEHTRQRLGRSICARYADDHGQLNVLTLDSDWQQRIADTEHWMELLNPSEMEKLITDIERAAHPLLQAGSPVIVLVASEFRQRVRQLTKSALPEVIALGYREVPPEVPVVPVGVVTSRHAEGDR